VRWLVLITLLTSAFAQAAAVHPLLNDREGKSNLLSSSQIRSLNGMNLSRAVLERDLLGALETIKGDACAFNLNGVIGTKLVNHPTLGGNFDLFLRSFRHQGLIDDVVLEILLRAYGVQKDTDRSAADAFRAATTEASLEMRPLREFSVKRARGKCLHENYREMMAAYRKQSETFNSAALRKKLSAAVAIGELTEKAASELKELIRDDVDSWEISLADYVTKRQFLRTQFDVNTTERADFVTAKVHKGQVSHRQRLYAAFTPIQITLMGNVIKKLKTRLESPKIEILVYEDEDTVQEVITLDPMERFRFAIRVLRKEMKLLSTNNYFAGRQPSYTDLMAAAYETGIITALELDQVAKLEEIWNPQQTFWDRAAVWVRMFSGVLSVVVPPPYGFLPALGITVIEMLNRDPVNDDQDSLF
jgi:hypothetical protein